MLLLLIEVPPVAPHKRYDAFAYTVCPSMSGALQHFFKENAIGFSAAHSALAL